MTDNEKVKEGPASIRDENGVKWIPAGLEGVAYSIPEDAELDVQEGGVGRTILKLSEKELEETEAGLDAMQVAMAKINAEKNASNYKGVFDGAFAEMGF